MDLQALFELGREIFGIVFCAFPVVSLLMWLTPQSMKNKIFPILAILLLFALVIMPSKVNVPGKVPGFDRLKQGYESVRGSGKNAAGSVSNAAGSAANSAKDLAYGSIDGVSVRGYGGKKGDIHYIDQRMSSQQVIPERHNDVDRWGYDNKYYRKIDRGYNINIMDDIRLEQRNVRGLLGRSTADITFYNKGLFNSGYGGIEVLVISYDKYGNYLGERIEVLNDLCICKSEKHRRKLQISRDTDEVIVKMLRASPCECLDWYKKAEREKAKAQKQQDKLNQRNLDKQYKEWESEQARQRDEIDRIRKKEERQAQKEWEDYQKELARKNKKANKGNKYGLPGGGGIILGGGGDSDSYVHEHDGYGPHRHKYDSGDHNHSGGGGYGQGNGNGGYQIPDNSGPDYSQYPDYEEFMKSRNAKIPSNVEVIQSNPNHVESYCDCRQCRYKRGKGTQYNFEYKR